jgi:Cu2+-exporting ATPase
LAGSLNGDQPVVVRVTHSSAESTLSEINRLVERSLRSRPYYAELAQRAATWLVFIILLVAVITAAVWVWLDPAQLIQNVVAVLIVTCPCALALATPVAISLSAGRFTDLGLLPMRMSALEPFATSDVIAFDKTGTLTQGRPVMHSVESLTGLPENELKCIAASLETASEHPLAQAFRDAYSGKKEVVQAMRVLPSSGVEGRVRGVLWRLGTPEFVTDISALEERRWRRIQSLRGQGYSVVMLADERGPQALFGLMDPARPGLRSMMVKLRSDGVKRFVILSGDHIDSVARLAAQLDIEEFMGGLTPLEKLDWIRRTQAQGRRVVMIGDGINDAPTLAAADASVSFSQASKIAQVSSDFVIIGATLERVAAARRLARSTRRIILQNLSWALAYNLAAIPLAAMGYIPPWGAAIGMSLSSFLVVANSLRLRASPAAHANSYDGVIGTEGSQSIPAPVALNKS